MAQFAVSNTLYNTTHGEWHAIHYSYICTPWKIKQSKIQLVCTTKL